MIIIVDGFDKSGRTTLAKKLGEESIPFSFTGWELLDTIPAL